MRECVSSAVETGLRIEAEDLDRRELEQGLQRDLEQLVRDEAASATPFVPRHLEVSFRSFELEPGVVVSGKIDRVDGAPMGAHGIVIDYKSGAASSASEIRERDLLQLPLYMLVLRRQLGLEPLGGIYVPVGGGRRPRGMLRAGPDAVPGFSDAGLPRAGRLRRGSRGGPRYRRRPGRADPQRRRPSRPSGRRVPALVRPLADLPEGATVRSVAERPAARGDRGARERVRGGRGRAPARRRCSSSDSCARVVDDGLDVDSLLVITYTERAAGELRARIRVAAASSAAGRISRSSSTAPGCRPSTGSAAVSWGVSARRGRRPAFPRARRAAGARAPGGGLHDRPRAVLRGRRARPLAAARDVRGGRAPSDARRGLRDAALRRARAGARARRATPLESRRRRRSARPRRCLGRRPEGDRRPAGAACCSARARRGDDAAGAAPRARRLKARGPRAAAFAEARDVLVAAALEELAARDRELLQELLDDLRGRVRGREGRESALDFEDLQLERPRPPARRRGDPGARAAALPLDHGGRVPGHEPPPDRAARPALRRRRTATSSSSATSSSRSTGSAMPTSRCSGSVARPRRPFCR